MRGQRKETIPMSKYWREQTLTTKSEPYRVQVQFHIVKANEQKYFYISSEIFPLLYSRSTEEKVSVTEPGSVIRTPTPNEGKSAAVTTGDVSCVLTQVKKGREVVH